MNHLIQILLPILIIILIGFFCGEKTVGNDQSKALNMFVYFYAFPALIVKGLISEPIDKILNKKFILGYLGASILIFALAMLRGKKFQITHRTLMALSASFPNCGYIGIPLITALFGTSVLLPAIVATVISLFHFTLIIVFLELSSRDSDNNLRDKLLKTFANSVSNPMILCFIVGLAISALNPTIPSAIMKTLNLLAAACVPCALFGIGHNLAITKSKIGLNFYAISEVFILKNIIHGLVAWILLYSLHVNSQWVVIGVIMSSLSTGLVLPIMASKYNAYQNEAPQAVFVTTIASLISLSIWVMLLQQAYPLLLWN